ncbi:hypothetical protein QOT17_017943 [Balamuthia mandrillaris]
MPNDNTIYMPVFLTQEAIYEDMTTVLETGHLISYSGFCVLLKTHFANVHFPKITRLGKCDACCKLVSLFKACKTDTDQRRLSLQWTQHLQFVRHHKEDYYAHHAEAKASPASIMSLILDYIEAIPLPHLHIPPKAWNNRK